VPISASKEAAINTRMRVAGIIVSAILVFSGNVAVAGQIHKAIESGDIAKVKKLLAADRKLVNQTTDGGATPLHIAVGLKNVAMVRLLVESGADLKAATPEGYTALHWAAYMNATDVATYLLSKGIDANAKTKTGLSAFQIAIKENATGVAKLLAEKTGAPYKEAFLDDTFVQGEQALASGDLARAYSIFNELLKKDPGNEKVNFALGLACKSLRDFSRAQLAFERVLQINPDNDRARFELGRIYLERKQFAAAGETFRAILAHQPPASVKEEVEKLLLQAESGLQRWTFGGRLDVGGIDDDNVNVGPDSEVINIAPIIFGSQSIDTLTVEEESRPVRAKGLFASGVLSAAYDMGEPREWGMTMAGAYFQNWLDGERSHESTYARVGLGPGHVAARNRFEVLTTAAFIENGHEPLVTIYGVAPMFRWANGGKADWQWTTTGAVDYRDYDTLNDRDGAYVQLNQSFKHYIGARRSSLSMGIAISHDYTDEDVYENTAIEWNMAGELRLPWNSALYGKMRYIESDYSARETLAPEDRADTQSQFIVGGNKMITSRWGLDINHQITDNNSTFGLYRYDRAVTTISTFCGF
jgi:tetratricopeptide (TPR) repeat protein